VNPARTVDPAAKPQAVPEAAASEADAKPAIGADDKAAANAAADGAANAAGIGAGNVAKKQRGDMTKDPRATRLDPQGMVKLSFKNEKIEGFIPYIQEWTGKAVMVKSAAISAASITLVYDKELSKNDALDLVFTACKINDIAVVESSDLIIIASMTDLPKLTPGQVLAAEINPLDLDAEGISVTKIFRMKHAKAADIAERLQDAIPENAKLTVDVNSNQIVLEGDIGLAQKIQLLVQNLDVPGYLPVHTETFRIRFQDASIVADSIRDLFEGYSPSGGGGGNRQARQQPRAAGGRQQQPGGQQPGQQQTAGTAEPLVVSVLPALNSLTVRAEPLVMDEIRKLIRDAWDLPVNSDGSPFRTYDLKYTDPIRIRDTLQALLETGGGQTRSGGRAAAGGRNAFQGGAAGGQTGADAAVANVFRFEAYPDSKRLIVISKTPDNFKWLDEIVVALDQPLDTSLPRNVPLKYASAFEIADILNILLAQSGSGGAGLVRPDEGLSGIDFETAGGGGASAGTGGGTSGASNTGGGGAGGGTSYPWQSGRGAASANAEQSEPSGIVGKVRILPNAGQNSLLVLAPPEAEEAVIRIIEDLDRPGRQVMITAVLAEVSLGDGFSWGLRVGSNLTPLNGGDNSISGSASLDLSKGNGTGGGGANFASPWFDVSLLNVGTEVGFLLQALQQTNNVRILQEPRVFTSDNAEAKFFAGQDITFQTGQTTGGNTGGGTTSSFQQQAVGIGLNVRPRITRDRNVFMELEILLSNLNLSVPEFNNNPVVDRRQTNTKVTVKNGQTIVLSGIRREEETSIRRALPFLGEIPGLDAIFASTEKKKTIAELVIFVTPIVVENPEENYTNFNLTEMKRLDAVGQPLDELNKKGGGKFFYDRMRELDTERRPLAQPAPEVPPPG